MPEAKTEKQLRKIDKDHEKTVELLERELEAVRDQAAAAQTAAQQAQQEVAELEERRMDLVLASFSDDASGAAEASRELRELEHKVDELGRRIELAALAESQASKATQAIEERLQASEREAAERRYDAYALERKERTEALDETLGKLAELAGSLIELDQHQRQEEPALGRRGGDMAYAELLDVHLRCRLAKFIQEAARTVAQIDMRHQRAPLVEKDHRTKTLGEARAENAAEAHRAEEQTAQRTAWEEAKERRDRFEYRRAELRARHGFHGGSSGAMSQAMRQRIEAKVTPVLRAEFPDLVEAEEQAALQARRDQLRRMLAGGEDYASLSGEKREEIDRGVESWLEDEEVTVVNS